jgi:hypothetical protein
MIERQLARAVKGGMSLALLTIGTKSREDPKGHMRMPYLTYTLCVLYADLQQADIHDDSLTLAQETPKDRSCRNTPHL